VAIEVLSKDFFQQLEALVGTELVEPESLPGVGRALDDKGGCVGAVRV
jgi:hypothetical protein